jgi:hypothetical protein
MGGKVKKVEEIGKKDFLMKSSKRNRASETLALPSPPFPFANNRQNCYKFPSAATPQPKQI